MHHFESFLATANAEHERRRQRRDGWGTILNTLGFFGLAGVYFATDVGFWVCVVVFIVWAGVIESILKGVFNRADAKRRRRNPLEEQTADRIAEFDDYRRKLTLIDRFHPKVAEALEACAARFSEISDGLNNPEWKQLHPGSEWAKVADQSRRVAETSLKSAVNACGGGYRPRGMPKKTWIAKLERDPDAAPIVAKLHTIEADLDSLANALGVRLSTGASLVEVLGNLEEIRRAEEELDQTVDLSG